MRSIRSTLRPVFLTAFVSLAAGLTGCVSSGYQRADKSTPPAISLGWETATAPVDLTLQTLIVYHGQGSWKANAYWDEYVVTLRNTSSSPQTITRALLTDFQGSPALTGDNPWLLEKQSRTKLDRVAGKAGNIVAIGAGTALASTAVGGAVIFPLAYSSAGVILTGAAGAALAMGAVAAAPAAVIYKNISSKHGIEDEFSRRRLVLPLTIAPGQELTGSFFFPVTPGPRHLQLQLQDQSLFDAIDLPLPLLSSLHLEPTSDSTAIPLRIVTRKNRHYLTIKIATVEPNGTIRINGQIPAYAPAEEEVEVDRNGLLLDNLEIFAVVASVSHASGYMNRIVLPAGVIPPAKVEFSKTSVRQTQFNKPASALPETP